MQFTNPTGTWSHNGPYTVELTEDADTSIVPSSASVNGMIVTVPNGRIAQSMGGIDLESNGSVFHYGYRWIRCFRDGNGKLLWVNSAYRDEITE